MRSAICAVASRDLLQLAAASNRVRSDAIPTPRFGALTARTNASSSEGFATKRMYAIVNHNNDIAEYWEWSDTNELSIDYTNDAYKLGINYVVYAMTH